MRAYKTLKRSIKEMKGEKITLFDKIDGMWYDLWRYVPVFRHIRDFYYASKHYLFDRYDLIKTGLPKTQYSDPPERILYGIMNTVVEFVEEEKCFETIDYTASPYWQEVGDTIKEVYDWWKDYPNRQKQIEIALNNWHDAKFGNGVPDNWLDKMNFTVDSDEVKRYNDIHDELEAQLAKEEDEMLIKVMKIRKGLWT